MTAADAEREFNYRLQEAQRCLRAKSLFYAGEHLALAERAAQLLDSELERELAMSNVVETRRACIRQQAAALCRDAREEREEKMRAIQERQPDTRMRMAARRKPSLRLVPKPLAKPAPVPADKYETLTCDVLGDVVTATLFDLLLQREYEVEVDYAAGTSSVTCWYDLRSSDPVLMPLAELDSTESLRVELWAVTNLRSEWEQDVKRRVE